MNKKISLGAAIAFMLIVATATFSMTMIYATNKFDDKVVALKAREVQYEKFGEIDLKVRERYNGTINETSLMDSVASGYIAGLGDPHAAYIDARTYEKQLRDEEGSLVGIGAVLEANAAGDGYLTVLQVYGASPAEAEGMEAGDLIVKIDDVDLTPENSVQMLEEIQGESGTKVTLVVRKGSEEVTLEIVRRPVIIPRVYSSMIENTDVGYIWIEDFSDKNNTSDQFNREVQRLIDAGAKSLIFDVRDNTGKSIRQSARTLDKLLPAGLIASYTENDGTMTTFTSDANEIDLPMVVVVNGNTAGAAELFAQVLKEYGKAKVVGATTMGKGIIQETIQLKDGSAIRITTAELMGPNNETFNIVGVKPDFEASMGTDVDWRELDHLTDAQLVKALEVVQGLRRTSGSPEEQEDLSEPDTTTEEQSSELPEEPESSQPEESSSEDDESSGSEDSQEDEEE